MILRGEWLEVIRNGRPCLKEATVSFHPGEVAAIVGPNGAGKSTLLRCLAGVLRPDRGKVRIGDEDLASIPPRHLARLRAFLPQDHHIPFPITVRELVELGRIPHRGRFGWYGNESERVERALSRVEMEPFVDRLVRTLSGGERQRVHFARVLAQLETEEDAGGILLLDEPVSALDLRHQHGLLTVARAIAREKHLTAVVVLHDLNHALAYADSVCLMDQGRILGTGTPQDLLSPRQIKELYGLDSHYIDGPTPTLRILPPHTRTEKMETPTGTFQHANTKR